MCDNTDIPQGCHVFSGEPCTTYKPIHLTLRILSRKLFLAVKFSKHDAKNVEARIESNGRIGGVTASTSKGVRQRLSAEEYRERMRLTTVIDAIGSVKNCTKIRNCKLRLQLVFVKCGTVNQNQFLLPFILNLFQSRFLFKIILTKTTEESESRIIFGKGNSWVNYLLKCFTESSSFCCPETPSEPKFELSFEIEMNDAI